MHVLLSFYTGLLVFHLIALGRNTKRRATAAAEMPAMTSVDRFIDESSVVMSSPEVTDPGRKDGELDVATVGLTVGLNVFFSTTVHSVRSSNVNVAMIFEDALISNE